MALSHVVEALAHALIDADMRASWFTVESLTTTIVRARVDASIAKVVAPDLQKRADRD